MKNKKVIILLVIVLLLILFLGLFILNNVKEDNKVKEKITKVTEKFYEDTYYQTTNKEILKEFTEKGIVISLEELVEFEEEDKDEYKEYDMSKSNIKIYPKKPYNKKDYIIKIKLYRK